MARPDSAATSVSLTLPPGSAPSFYYRYGPTPENPAPHWYDWTFDGLTGAVISGNRVTDVLAMQFGERAAGRGQALAGGVALPR